MVEAQFITRPEQLESGGTPLRKFWGVLQPCGRDRPRIDLNFTDLEVLLSTPPWVYLTCQIQPNYSPRENSVWGILIKSLEDLKVVDFQDLIGRRVLMEAEEQYKFFTAADGTENRGMVWRVAQVEGATQGGGSTAPAGVTDEAFLMDILHGKNKSAFVFESQQTPIGKKSITRLMDDTNGFTEEWIARGLVEMEGDIYYIVGRER